MNADIAAIGAAFLLGLCARTLGLPPLVGYLIAGFVLYAVGMTSTETLQNFANMGVTLLLFSIGLKLRLGNLLMPQIWAVASLHMLVTVLLFTIVLVVFGVTGLSLFADLNLPLTVLIAFALSFSSTVFAVKVLEEKGEMKALYGRISIGILVVQDIAAVIFLAVSTGKVPSPWSLLLLAGLWPFRLLMFKVLDRVGHGELLVLLGLTLALGGAGVFELFSVKGDLGALLLGVLFASHPKSTELSNHLLSFKDLFLVGFFLTIGLSGPVSLEAVGIALLLVALVPMKVALFYWLLSRFHLRALTSSQVSLSLANYSEFGLIVGAIAFANGWISSEWLIVLAIALAISFIVAALLNINSHGLYSRYREWLLSFQREKRITEEQSIEMGEASVLIIGMGRVGTGAYDSMHHRLGSVVVGVDFANDAIERHKIAGRRVVLGSATDPDFWVRIKLDFDKIKLVMLTMPNQMENLIAVQHLQALSYKGRLTAVAKFPDEVEALKQAGVDSAYNLYAEAGTGFADDVFDAYKESLCLSK